MTLVKAAKPAPARIAPGAKKVIFRGDGAGLSEPFLCIVATQEESLDDGGSQCPIAILEIGDRAEIEVSFDLREIAAMSVPSVGFAVTVMNRNAKTQPSLEAWVFGCRGNPDTRNTLTFDVDNLMVQPNVRVPAYAQSFSYDLSGPGAADYKALLSDSETGETYGLAAPGKRYPITRRNRFVRFMNVPESVGGQLTFFLSL